MTSKSIRARALALLVAAPFGAAACSTVDLGDPPADVNACRPSEAYFVAQVWPNYLTLNINGKTCADTSCHGGTLSTGLTLVPPTSTPTPTFPLASGSDWNTIYISASQNMNCNDVASSNLWTRPTGEAMHGGGKLFDPGDGVGTAAFALLMQWISPTP